MTVNDIIKKLEDEGLVFAVLDMPDPVLRILVDPKDRNKLQELLGRYGWKRTKTYDDEKYLYGIEHFMQYDTNGVKLDINFRIACRSTLNSAWVPLDMIINEGALQRTRKINEIPGPVLSVEDTICYLAAKSVYTEKEFLKPDRLRLKKELDRSDEQLLMNKMKLVFFKFSGQIIQMMKDGEFEDIIPSFWKFAEY